MNKYLRTAATGLITGVTLVGTVWAGIGLAPVASDDLLDQATTSAPKTPVVQVAADAPLQDGEALVGASRKSLEPRPDDFGGVWVRNRNECLPLGAQALNDPERFATHVADWRTPWIENSNCIYMGGYGLGPSNPILNWDQDYGLWIRTTVVTDAQGDTLVLTLLDAEGFFGNYNLLCGDLEPNCGAFDISEDLGDELGISPDGFIIASTHAHTALDLIGGWGAVPGWYMDQIITDLKDSVREAMANRVPATITAGETLARGWNSERRSTYYSAQDPSINWFQARNRDGDVISTVGTYATHPVSVSASAGVGHGDFPAVFSKELEQTQGGMATLFQAGLGNMTGGGNWKTKGEGIAATLDADLGSGTLITNPDVRTAKRYWDQPVTNGPLAALGGGGFFDKPFAGPASISVGKSGAKPCRSASPVSALVSVTAAKIGPVVVTAAPGEIFANFSNTIEERSPVTALAIGQANDALGYMPQSFESDVTARQGTGFIGGGVFEYEDAYAIDTCFGDAALVYTLELLGAL
ncbi:MAG: hypothetical protein ACLGH3_06355 [Actinomycetota bacterium]